MFGNAATSGLARVLSGIRDLSNGFSRGVRERRAVQPWVVGLETRNLLSHATPMAASGATIHSASAEVQIPNYPYSGRGRPRDLLLRQVPMDLGPQSLQNYFGVAVREGSYFPKQSRGKLELLITGYVPPNEIVHGFGVSHGVKYNGYDVAVYTGKYVYNNFPGTVVKVVKNWTPKSHDPNGNQVVVRTVEPDGIVFYIRYSHLLSDINVKVGEYLSPAFSGYIGRAGHTGVPANQSTTYSFTIWTPQFGGQYLGKAQYIGVSPVSIGIPPGFVDLDPNPDGSSDDPDNDTDDPGGFNGVPPGSP